MVRTKTPSTAKKTVSKTVLMLLTNAYDPDPRVRQEALSLIRMGYRVRLLAWDRDRKSPPSQCMEVDLRRKYAESARRFGSSFMNWTKGEKILFTEYSAMLGWPAANGESAVARTMSARAGAR